MIPAYPSVFLLLIIFNIAHATEQEIKIAAFLEPPFVNYVDKHWHGENIEMAKLLASKLNLTPKFIQCPFARCLALVKTGQADMVMGLKKSTKRAQYLTFIEPPYLLQHKPLRFFTLASKSVNIEKFEDLDQLLVGVLRGGVYYEKFDKSNAIKKVSVTSRDQLVKMLLKGRIDTFLEREETISPLLSREEYQQKITLAQYQYNKTVASYIAISKKSKINHLAQHISKALTLAIQLGELKQNRAK